MERSGDNLHNYARLVTIAAMAGSLLLGMSGCGNSENGPQVVKGVPVRVEQHFTGRYCVEHLRPGMPFTPCVIWGTKYYLNVEQCTADVTAVKDGKSPKPFDASQGCYDQQIPVSQDNYNNYPDGSVLEFSGPVGEPVVP